MRIPHITDSSAGIGSGQGLACGFFALLGTPVDPGKKQPMSQRGAFLGLEHDLTEAVTDGVLCFWPKQALIEQARGIINEAREDNFFCPALAAKYKGLMNCTAIAMWKQEGNAALGSIKQRQYAGTPPSS